MGWTFQNGKGSTLEIKREFHIDEPPTEHGRTYTDLRLKLRAAYFVARQNGVPEAIVVCLIDRRRNDMWGNSGEPSWGYKDMDETMGPYEADCPLDLLEICPCPDNDYARQWRERVRAYHEARKPQVKLDSILPGGAVRLVEGLTVKGWLKVYGFKLDRRGKRRIGVKAGGYYVKHRQIAEYQTPEEATKRILTDSAA